MHTQKEQAITQTRYGLDDAWRKQQDELADMEFAIEQSDKKIKQLNTRIYVIKKETRQQLDAVDLFGDDELEQFFAKRYRQHSDSIN